MQIFAIVVSLAFAVVGLTFFVRAIRHILGVVRMGQPAGNRSDRKGTRWATLVKETLGHTRMLQWSWVGIGHWFIFVGFGLLFFTLLTAFGQLFDAHFVLPLIGTFFLYEWVTEFFTVVMIAAIVAFIAYRATRPRERERGPKGRFYGSTMWQGYFVEAVILGVGLCIVLLRGAEYALAQYGDHPELASAFHFPFTFWIGEALGGMSEGGLENLIWLVATLKIVISFTWMIVLGLNPSMGVAWHRFTAWFNIWFKRESDGGTALGALQPMMSGGKPVDFEDIEEMDEDTVLGVGKVEDFSWKGILDFTSCTECGRCQSQCPAWNTEKPLSPKLLITQLRDHAYAKAAYVNAEDEAARQALPVGVLAEAERPLVGATEGEWAWMPEGGAVIDDDVLWSCTSCGACVQQCPVDIEHVDHIMDMRRYQVLVESNFPAELNQLFKGLENKGNPWNMSAKARLDWAKDLPFEVKVIGEDIESLDEVDWLFWVGCAGAYEDRAKKTTRAVAELLDMAGVSFGVLGNGETCTGDPARRAGNEFVFQGLATQNAEVFKETRAKKVVSTCAHCFNTLKNEYAQFGVELEVVHHTQLLNRLVREGKLTPVATNGSTGAAKRNVTYHDPCYLGRHNQVYAPPRELLTVIPDTEFTEMPRNSERSFCCGAGGARMWMEENIGERININRTQEAIDTGADQIAVGCPFCRVMLSDGLTMQQSKGEAREEVEVLDVAQMLLASVKGEVRTPVPAAAAAVSSTGAATATAAPVEETRAEETQAEPSPDASDTTQTEDTVTEPKDVGAGAVTGGSLFDDPAPASDPEPETESVDEAPEAAKPAASGGSLFDVGSSEAPDEPSQPEAKPEVTDTQADNDQDIAPTQDKPEAAATGGGSLFDIPSDHTDTKPEPEPEPGPEPEAKPEVTDTQADNDQDIAPTQDKPEAAATGGGSLFDIPSDHTDTKPEPEPEPEPEAKPEVTDTQADNDQDIAPTQDKPEAAATGGGSLFDIPSDHTDTKPEPEPEPGPEPEAKPEVTDTQADNDQDIAPTQDKPEAAATGGGSLFDIPSDHTDTKPEPEPEPEPGPEPEAKPEVTDTQADNDQDIAPTQDKPEAAATGGGSLFDIPSDHDQATPASTGADTGADADDQPESPRAAAEPAAASDDGQEPPIRSLKDIKAEYADQPADEPAESDETVAPTEAPEEAAEEPEAKPAAGPTSKSTDQAESLFDL